MSKFKLGDKVVCINADYADDLNIGSNYTIKTLRQCEKTEVQEYFLEGVSCSWMESRFELLSEWKKHQKPVDTETELKLTKMQVESLQHYKNQANYLLSRAVVNMDNFLINEIKRFLDTGKLS